MAVAAQLLLDTPSITLRDVIADGCCAASEEKHAFATALVFAYRGLFVRHVDGEDVVAEPNQVLFFNRGEAYRVTHPVAGGDASLCLAIAEPLLDELVPAVHRRPSSQGFAFAPHRLQIDARAQALVALLRHGLLTGTAEVMEAEALALTLARRVFGPRRMAAAGSAGLRKLADRAKLVLSADLARRWTLAEIAVETGVSPVYLTQVFQQVEGLPLYRYQLRLRLARALDRLADCEDLTALGLDLGFSSHSHFSAAFRKAYGRTPAEFQRFVGLR